MHIMRLFQFALSLIFLSACGTAPVEQAAPTTTPAGENGGIERQPDEPTENVVEYRKDGDQLALALEDTADLPACAHANEHQLAWIKSTEQFFTCQDETWVEVPVKGKDGASGPQGPIGPQGEPGRPPAANEWVDPISGERWLVGIRSIVSGSAESVCGGMWCLPTSAEASAAVLHGLLVVSSTLNGPVSLWSSEFSPDTGGRHFILGNAQVYTDGVSLYGGTVPGVACIAQGEVGE